jgi:DsbC/DsbD-like thiol-disulfide interchange protein
MFVSLLLATAMTPRPPRTTPARARSRSVSAPRTGDIQLALHLEIDPQWHVYWRNAGAAGLPPRIEWAAPASVPPRLPAMAIADTIPCHRS